MYITSLEFWVSIFASIFPFPPQFDFFFILSSPSPSSPHFLSSKREREGGRSVSFSLSTCIGNWGGGRLETLTRRTANHQNKIKRRSRSVRETAAVQVRPQNVFRREPLKTALFPMDAQQPSPFHDPTAPPQAKATRSKNQKQQTTTGKKYPIPWGSTLYFCFFLCFFPPVADLRSNERKSVFLCRPLKNDEKSYPNEAVSRKRAEKRALNRSRARSSHKWLFFHTEPVYR